METKHHLKLTTKERDLIALWKSAGVGVNEMARRLARAKSTVSEEIKRNSFKSKDESYYVSIHAQAVTEKRKLEARKRSPLKDAATYSFVLDKLRGGWSPEQIVGKLKKETGKTIICTETIYQFIYAKKNQDLKLWEYLPWKRQKRKKKQGRQVHRSHIPHRVSIHERPEKVNQRSEFGHWEGDTVEGKGHQDGIHTEVERLSRLLAARKVPAITSEEALKAQKEIFQPLPKVARQSTTLDNGRENHLHYQLREINMGTYFADPYSSWQRGTNEHHNGLLRRYLPKGTYFANLAQEELEDIVWEINNRPRKCLNFNTPQEVFELHLKG